MLPSLFISHGSPELVMQQNSSTRFLKKLPNLFQKPKYILIISAHWITSDLQILSTPNPNLVYDFFGFPQELYERQYPIKNDLVQVDNIVSLLNHKNIPITKNIHREGYDHGVWTILSLMYPSADIPVIQLSLPSNYSETQLIKLGAALQELREETLIITSGSMTHNIREAIFKDNLPIKSYAKEFRDWVVKSVEDANTNELKDFNIKAPHFKQNHPTSEHFVPLLINLGTSSDSKGRSLNNEFMYGNLSMDTILFEN